MSPPSNIPTLTHDHKRLLRFTTSRTPELENQQLAVVFIVYRESRFLPMNREDVATKIKEQFDVTLPPEKVTEVQHNIGAVGRKVVLDMMRALMREGQGRVEGSETKVEDGMSNIATKEEMMAEEAVLSWFEKALKGYQNPSLLTPENPTPNDGLCNQDCIVDIEKN